MTTPEFTKCLRENSLGDYRPAAAAADQSVDQGKVMREAVACFEHQKDCICAWCEVERQNVEIRAATEPLMADCSSAPCSASWFLNGAEYRSRNGYIEARNNLNPDWVIVDKDESSGSPPDEKEMKPHWRAVLQREKNHEIRHEYDDRKDSGGCLSAPCSAGLSTPLLLAENGQLCGTLLPLRIARQLHPKRKSHLPQMRKMNLPNV